MTKYYTRVKRRRVYAWAGRPILKDRKVLSLQYGGLVLKSDTDEDVTITPGDVVLIEGENEERPFVAKLCGLYDDGTEKDASKHAIVEWFVRYEEVPIKKRNLLGRESHPREIFLYEAPSCDNDIDAETIIGLVKVLQLKPEDTFPAQVNKANVLFVKFSWNGKAFKPLTSRVLQEEGERNGHATRRPLPHFYPPERDTAEQGTAENGLATRSASKAQRNKAEIESRHSASKNSHSKERGAQKVSGGASTPGARKKLQLSSPVKSPNTKFTRQDILNQLLGDDSDTLASAAPKRRVAFSVLPDSPPKKTRSDLEESGGFCIMALKPTRDGQGPSDRLRLTPSRRMQHTMEEGQIEEQRSDKLALKPCTRSQEQQDGTAPQTPRSSRKSARESNRRSRQQLKILADSDVEDKDEDKDCVPIKTNCVSSSSEGDEGESEHEEGSPRRGRNRGVAAPRTPTSSRKSSARTPNKTPVSRTPRMATPRIPERSQPVRKPGSVLEEARVRLHVSAVPDSLPCREQEFQDIYHFVESKLLDSTGGCMYISGVPGTGKTATVHEVIRCLQRAVEEEEELPSFQYIEINGMKLTDPHQAYVQILRLLTGQKATADHAAALLDKRFSTPAPKRETTVLLVDELDLLWTRKQNVMYSLFDWPTRKQAKLIVLAIANTMDLPERIMMNRVASRLGLTRMSFQPYAYKQLQQIITSRLNHVKAFEDDAIQLVARKVAALSGDARRCLDICRRATEICEFSCKKSGPSLVGMSHVIEALEEMFSSPYIIAIRSSSVLEQTFLKAVISEFRRSGLEEATFQQVCRQHIALCRIEGLQPPSMSETMAVCLRLGASRLLLVEPSRNDLYLRVRLNVSQDDIMYALKEE
ncbi:origin recognition complex subunit 1 isoform X2 [Ascaphus truei]|uniref:origin recognition complex subunit 1 isoform X2 n=1 Tax=Ascaphus truei TaxID=8439 RepID=UPI003F5A7354